MEFLANFRPTTTISIHPPTPTSTISVDPPGGTGRPHPPHHPPHYPHPPPQTEFPTPIPRFLHATNVGHTALWVVFALFTLGLIGVFIMSLRVEKRARIFHWLSALVLTCAMVSYFAMATGLGISFVPIHNHGSKGSVIHLFREVYWARYIDWLFTTPLLLVSLAVLSGLSPSDTLLVILFDVFMIVTGLLGGTVSARYASGERARWGFFAVSCIAFLGIWWVLVTGGMQAAKLRPRKTRGLYFLLAGMTLLLWTAYPVIFALTEGTNKLSVDFEIIAYAVLDVAAKIGFTFMLLFVHTHGDDDVWVLPEWFITPRQGGTARDGRGNYGAINSHE